MVVEQAEGLGVAAAGQLDERDQPGTLGLVDLRGGGLVGVAEDVAVAVPPAVAGAADRDVGLGEQDVAPDRSGRGRGEGEEHGAPQRVEPLLDVGGTPHGVVDDPPQIGPCRDLLKSRWRCRRCEPSTGKRGSVSGPGAQWWRRPRTVAPAATAPPTAPAAAATTSPARAALRPVR